MTSTLALIEGAIREINAGAEESFGTLVIPHDEDRWLQILQGNINAAYPTSNAPEAHLARLGFDAMIEWKAGGYVSVELTKPPEELAVWIDRYFQEVLGCGPDYKLDWKREQ